MVDAARFPELRTRTMAPAVHGDSDATAPVRFVRTDLHAEDVWDVLAKSLPSGAEGIAEPCPSWLEPALQQLSDGDRQVLLHDLPKNPELVARFREWVSSVTQPAGLSSDLVEALHRFAWQLANSGHGLELGREIFALQSGPLGETLPSAIWNSLGDAARVPLFRPAISGAAELARTRGTEALVELRNLAKAYNAFRTDEVLGRLIASSVRARLSPATLDVLKEGLSYSETNRGVVESVLRDMAMDPKGLAEYLGNMAPGLCGVDAGSGYARLLEHLGVAPLCMEELERALQETLAEEGLGSNARAQLSGLRDLLEKPEGRAEVQKRLEKPYRAEVGKRLRWAVNQFKLAPPTPDFTPQGHVFNEQDPP
jgi:hypothetical protein